MNDHHRITDAAIERMLDRRAPDGADAALLRAVLETVARTRQQRTWWASPAPSLEIPRLAFALVAIGLVIGMAILSITAGGIGPSRGILA